MDVSADVAELADVLDCESQELFNHNTITR